jgi:uncharacterized membrane protein YphA (DoxX/SURF4 family)
MMLDERLKTSWWALRLCYGLVPIIAGLDKFTNLLTQWSRYLNPAIERLLPAGASGDTFMQWIGVIEVAVGLLVLSNFVRWGAYAVCLWLVAIAINLVSAGQYYDIAVRDIVMAVGAFTLAKLTEAGAGEGALRTRRARPVIPEASQLGA